MATDNPQSIVRPGDEYDVFISHAGEDKEDVARPLTKALENRGLVVWLDEQELTVGDTLGRKIDEGLARSRFGVVVLSERFFAKHWPRRELDGLVARETLDGAKVILPVWHGITAEQVTAESPTLAARLAANTAGGIERVADEILRALQAASELPARIAAAQATAPAVVAGEPGAIHDAVLALLRASDEIALDRTIRTERAAFESAVGSVTADFIDKHLDEASVRIAGHRLIDAAERRLASLIPLAFYRGGALTGELRAHGGWMTRTELRGGSATWQEAWRFPWWMIGFALGGLLCHQERFGAVGEIVRATWLNRFGESEAFVGHPGDVGDAVARLFVSAPGVGRTPSMPVWAWWSEHLRNCEWLRERYADWLDADGQPDASMAAFDMIDGIAEALRSGGTVAAFWSLHSDAAGKFARRLYGDPGIRADVAKAVGVDLDTFDERAPGILASVHSVGMPSRTQQVANLLRTGNFRE